VNAYLRNENKSAYFSARHCRAKLNKNCRPDEVAYISGNTKVVYDFMRALISISLLLLCTICKSQSDKTLKQTKDTLILNHQIIVQTFKEKKLQSLTTLSGDTVLKNGDYYSNIVFVDINDDGFKDIRAFVISNTPNQCENYLYDKANKTFRQIEACDLDIQLIKGTKFFYSYDRAGCADMNWESYLSKIENFKLVSLGYIYGQGCDFQVKENPQEIKIYKITNPDKDQKVLFKKLPYRQYIPKFEDKWYFIKNYWKKNWQTFAK
jgi:hypothetical protein